MKTFSLRHLLLLAGGIISLGFLTMPAFGQDTGKAHELQRIIEAQQKQLEVQQTKLEAQQKQLEVQQTKLEAQQKQLEVQQKQLDAQRQALKEVQSQINPNVA